MDAAMLEKATAIMADPSADPTRRAAAEMLVRRAEREQREVSLGLPDPYSVEREALIGKNSPRGATYLHPSPEQTAAMSDADAARKAVADHYGGTTYESLLEQGADKNPSPMFDFFRSQRKAVADAEKRAAAFDPLAMPEKVAETMGQAPAVSESPTLPRPAPLSPEPTIIPGGWFPADRSTTVTRMGRLPAGTPTLAELAKAGEKAAASKAAEAGAEDAAWRLEHQAASDRMAAARDEQAQALSAMRMQQQRQEVAEQRYADLSAEAKRLAMQEPDFERFWGTGASGIGRRIAAVFAATISGAAMGLVGRFGENPTLDMINREIDRDITSQERRLAAQRGVNAEERDYVQRLADKAEALGMRWQDLARVSAREWVAAKADGLRSKATSERNKAQLATAADALRAQNAMEIRAHAERQAGQVTSTSRQTFVAPQVVGGVQSMPLPTNEEQFREWAPRYMNAGDQNDPKDAKMRSDVVGRMQELVGLTDYNEAKNAAIRTLKEYRQAVTSADGITRLKAAWGWRAGDAAILGGLESMAMLAVNKVVNGGRASDVDLQFVKRSLRPGWLYSGTPEMIDHVLKVIAKARPAIAGDSMAEPDSGRPAMWSSGR